jgi:predicted metalloprotease
MQTEGRRSSSNVEDRRRMSPKGKMALGGGTAAILLIILQLLMGGDSSQILEQVQQMSQPQQGQVADQPTDPQEDKMAEYVSVALADNEDVWNKLFAENGMQYAEPKLVLFRESTESACGYASAATGPFYCPPDQKIYIDLTFFDQLQSRFGAKGGDFAMAYVLAHEVGHHVQNQLGTLDKVHRARQTMSEKEANKVSVSAELQADFYAGVWAHHNQQMKGVLERGDIEEALSAASAVGDDQIQKKTQGYVVPESFTHGTSEERMKWFMLGYESGDLRKGNELFRSRR